MESTTLKLRLGQHDAHYAGNLVDGARILNLFGDAATELLIRYDGDEGLFRAYSSVDFLAPVYGGDFIEIHAKITKVGNSSRQMSFEAWKIITANPAAGESAADLLQQPQLVCRAEGTCITPKEKQRISHEL
jgi:3-aminobutyryl-CoA ammonia-lyase